MINKKILFISILFMIVLSIGAVSAEEADDAIASSNDDTVLEDSESTISGTVSGGVDIVTQNPNEYTGELSYDIPKDAKTIKSADVYVNIYGVRTDDQYGANVNTTIKTANGDKVYNESLCYVNDEEDHSIVHNVNDHVTKVYLNYMIHYDIKNLVSGLNGTKLTINVDSFKMGNKSFDGKIKLIALVLAYNDDSTDENISYWINDNQLWTKSNVNFTFNTEGKSGLATLTNVVLSSSDGAFKLNDQFLGDPKKHITGNSTFQYNQWDVTDLMNKSKNTTINVAATGSSLRNSLSVLTINNIQSSMSVATEYSNVAFAGTNNTLKVTISSSKSGKYVVRLLADGVIVNESEITLTDAAVPVFLTDPTIRAVDESSEKGADNKKVTYAVELLLKDQIINSTTKTLPILYNGNLGKDLAYPAGGMESFLNITINGDIVIDVKDLGSYLKGDDGLRNKTDVWTVSLDDNFTIVKSFIYVPYTWFDQSIASEDLNMFNTTFNGVKVTPIKLYRDQSNLGSYGKHGYGVLVYDVTSLINKTGTNTLFLSRAGKYPAIYPSVLVYMYNTTNSNTIKEIYINNGADLLSDHTTSYFNYANRTSKMDSTLSVYSKLTSNAKLYVFASNAVSNYGNIIFNGEEHKNVWDGESSCTLYYELDVTSKLKDSNSISFIATGGNILALQQIMVLTKNADDMEISIAPEYSGFAYAGTTNAITVTVDSATVGKFNATLLANGIEVNKTEIDLSAGKNSFVIIDPTIREVNASTVKGAANNNVNYTLQLSTKNATMSLPIVYNGNLGKDLAYPAGGMESFLNITINGDIVIDVKDLGSYLKGDDLRNKTDVWTVSLDDKSSIVKSFVYVPYNWCDPALASEDLTLFNVTFNGEKITPVKLYRDQSNLGAYGAYGYGVLVYDVTALMNKSGSNSLFVSRAAKYPAIYPSVLIYMYNTTGSSTIKNIYISNGADLLAESSSSFKNNANRIVKSDSTINVDVIADSATLYVVAASAQKGEGNIIFNGQENVDVWSGGSSTTDLYTLDITKTIKNTNDISFVSTGSTILALQQIIVTTKIIKEDVKPTPAPAPAPTPKPVKTTKKATKITAKKKTFKAKTKVKKYAITLKSGKKPVKKVTVTLKIKGKTYKAKTNSKGKATFKIKNLKKKGKYVAVIKFKGNKTYKASSKKVKITVKK